MSTGSEQSPHNSNTTLHSSGKEHLASYGKFKKKKKQYQQLYPKTKRKKSKQNKKINKKKIQRITTAENKCTIKLL